MEIFTDTEKLALESTDKRFDMTSDTIKGHTLEYIDESHTYLCDGVIVPSVTQILKIKFGGKYKGVSKKTLERAAYKGTEVHRAIELYCKEERKSDLPEVRNFKFLKSKYGFEVLDNEVPVILFKDGEPIAGGRLDLVISMDGKTGLADIKRTSTLDKEYLAYQLNMYRIAYQQCYDTEISFLKGVHLRENVRKLVDIPINEEVTMKLVNEYLEVIRNE